MEACTLHLLVLDLSNNSLIGLPPEIGKVRKVQLGLTFSFALHGFDYLKISIALACCGEIEHFSSDIASLVMVLDLSSLKVR